MSVLEHKTNGQEIGTLLSIPYKQAIRSGTECVEQIEAHIYIFHRRHFRLGLISLAQLEGSTEIS